MTHYQKLATMLFRVIGAVLMLTGVATLAVFLVVGVFFPPMYSMTLPFTLFYSLPLVLLGILFFASSMALARWVTVGFGEW
jgi:hypothetical protein